MMKFLGKVAGDKLDPEVIAARGTEFIHLQAERKLKEVAADLCEGLTPERIEKMAVANLRLSALLKETDFKVPRVTALARPAVNYLKSLPDERFLEILEEVVPEQVAVLRRYPEFAHTMTEDIKNLAGA